MRFAVLADIHGNLEALNATLKVLNSCTIDRFIILGDLVGYGADPNACTEIIRNIKAVAVAGNHDLAAAGKRSLETFTPYAKEALLWTRETLNDDNKKYLSSLPVLSEFQAFTIVHSSLDDPEKWKYVLDESDAETNFNLLKTDILFIGHSHIAGVFGSNYPEKNISGSSFNHEKKIQLLPRTRYIINAGSAGQPRDGNPKACSLIYDSAKQEVQFHRVEYNIPLAGKKIIDAGLPPILANRLTGGY
ncbi:MAG: metallophosphoesterase family protein [Candidatus Omnitrophica bacterium]|nr:metallophosphoesterase family protein [Candidatus Omnitrophota bacterium]